MQRDKNLPLLLLPRNLMNAQRPLLLCAQRPRLALAPRLIRSLRFSSPPPCIPLVGGLVGRVGLAQEQGPADYIFLEDFLSEGGGVGAGEESVGWVVWCPRQTGRSSGHCGACFM